MLDKLLQSVTIPGWAGTWDENIVQITDALTPVKLLRDGSVKCLSEFIKFIPGPNVWYTFGVERRSASIWRLALRSKKRDI